jgi:hypothetical protein
MKQYEAVIKIMEENGGFATLGYLYQNVLDVPGVKWNTKTPFASIRRIVQDDRFFFKIKPGLWALKSYRDVVLENFELDERSPELKKTGFNHSYYQGLILEIGNLRGFQTFVPNQDKNKLYLSKPLSEYSSLKTFYEFTYEHVVRRAVTIDVTWFNRRNFPDSFFEVEHTTDIQNSLLKFLELQDFHSQFFVVGPMQRNKEFARKLDYVAFDAIKHRVRFVDYDYVAQVHTKSFELYKLKQSQKSF